MRVILPTYKHIGFIVKPFFHFWNKFCGLPVTMIAEEDYSEGLCEFRKPPHIVDSDGSIFSGDFGDVLKWCLDRCEEELVIIMLADYLLTKQVNMDELKEIEEYMLANPNVFRCQIGDGAGVSGSLYKEKKYKSFEIYDGPHHQCSLTPGIFRRKMLVEFLRPGQSAWGVEDEGRNYVSARGWKSLWIEPSPMTYLNALRGRQIHDLVMPKDMFEEVKQWMGARTV